MARLRISFYPDFLENGWHCAAALVEAGGFLIKP
jgi:hypothetical protein